MSIIAARRAPIALDREAVAREIDRAFYQEGDSDGLSFRALAAADAVLALPGVTQSPTPNAVTISTEGLASREELMRVVDGDVIPNWARTPIRRVIEAMGQQAPTTLDREAVARVIYERTTTNTTAEWDDVGVDTRRRYLEDADAVLALPGVTQAPTVALDVETVARELDQHRWDRSGDYCTCGAGWFKRGHEFADHLANAIVAADPRRTEAEVKAEGAIEALEHFRDSLAGPLAVPLREALNEMIAAQRIAGAPDA